MVYRECTHHHRCALRKFSQAGENDSALPDLHSLFLALVLIISAETLPLGLSRSGAHLGKVARAPTHEIAFVVVRARCLLYIRPWAGLLLQRWHKVSLLLLLRRRNNPTPLLRGSPRGCSWSILHNTIPRCLGTVGISYAQ